MIDVKNNIGEVLFTGKREEAESFINSKPQPPNFPKNRTIKYNGFTFFGFKPTKFKHIFLIAIYLFSLAFSFMYVLINQEWNMFGYWFLCNLFLFGIVIMLNAILFIIKNWNKEL